MFLETVGAHLVTNNIVDGGTGWSLFEAFIPDSPDKVVVLTQTGGTGVEQADTQLVGEVSFQAFVRGGKLNEDASAYVDSRTKIGEVFANLNKAQLTGFTHLFALQPAGFFLGYDELKRPEWSLNFSGRHNL